MSRSFTYFLALIACVAMSAHANEVTPPAQLVLDGTRVVPLAAKARRTHLLGSVEIYLVAVYVTGSLEPARVGSSDVAKALRIDVTYIDDPRQRRLPFDWRRELVPPLESAATAHLRGTFAPLRHGDVVIIEYVPAKGTTIRINKAVAVSGAHHELMLAFLDHWLGQRPVSEEVKRTLLAFS